MIIKQGGYAGLYHCLFGETLSPRWVEKWAQRANLTLKHRLKENEFHILRLRLGLDDNVVLSQTEVGKKVGLSGSRVQQIEDDAIRKLRHPLTIKYLSEGIAPQVGWPWSEYSQLYYSVVLFFKRAYGIGEKISANLTMDILSGDEKRRRAIADMIRAKIPDWVSEFTSPGEKKTRQAIIDHLITASAHDRDFLACAIEEWDGRGFFEKGSKR